MAHRDPDEALVVVFKNLPMEDTIRSLAEGRPIFEDTEQCVICSPGSREVKVFPANTFARWIDDPLTGRPVKQSYAERFSYQYQQFKRQEAQTKVGTPLEYAVFLSEGRRAELKAQNIYTIEALAAVEGNELKNLGPGGRDMKNKATEYIDNSKALAPNKQMLAELEALRARNAILEEDNKVAQTQVGTEAEFENMSLEQLKEFITSNAGQVPIGTALSRKNLIRMAMNTQSEKVI